MSSMCAGRPHCQPQPTARSSTSTVPTTTTTTSTVFQPAPPTSYCVTASVRRRNQRLLLSGGTGGGGSGGGATITTAVAECPIRQHQSFFGISNVADGGGDGASVWSKTWKRRRCPAMVDRVDCGAGAQCGGSCSTTEDSSHIATDCRQRMTNFEKSEDHNQYHPSYKSRHPHHLHPDPQNEHHPCQRSQSASHSSRRLRCCHCSTCIALQASSQPQCPLQPPSLSLPSSEHQTIPPLFAQQMPITSPPPYGDRIESRLPVPLPHREPQQQQQKQSASAFCSRNPPQASATSPSLSSGRVGDHAQTGHQRLHEDGVEQSSRTCRAGIDCWSSPPPPPPSKLRMIVAGSAERTLQNNVVAASSLSSARRWRNVQLLLRLWCVFLLATTWLAPIVVVATAASSPAAAGGGGGAAGGLALAGGAGAPKYETAYACEGKTLTIECETGNLINLIRANYGRFSITICNDHGNVDWSVNCMSAKSLRVLHTKCSHKQNCSVLASTNMFGDPCPGTHKYLEAHYQCISAAQTSTTTSKPSPPWLITSQPSVWSTSTVRVPTTTRINIHDAAQQQAAAAAAAAAAVASSSKSNHSSMSHNHQKSAAANGRNGSSSSTTTGRPSTSSLSNLDAEGAFKIQPPDVLEHHQHHHHQQQQHPHRTDTDIDDDDDEAGEAAHDGGAQTVDAATNDGDPNDDQSAAVQNHNRNGSVALLPSASAQPPRHPTGVPLPTCGPKTARNLFWNSTRVGEVNVQPCPGGATGIAKWRCVYAANRNGGRLVASGSLDEMGAMSTDRSSYTARGPNNAAASAVDAAAAVAAAVVVWLPTTPDLTHCRSLWLNSLEVRVNQRDSSLIGIATDLSQVTSSKTLYGGDMLVTTKIIQTMSEKMTYDIETFADQRQRETVVMELLHGVVRTGSNLLDATQHLSWLDLSFEDQMRVATSLLTGIEDNAFLLAATIMAERNVVQKVKNILLSVRVLETRNIVGNELFPDAATGHTERWPVSDDVIELPRGALIENSDGGLVRIVFVAFDRLETILRPTWTTVEQQQQQQSGGDGNGPAGQPLTPQQQLLLQYGDGLADTGLGSSNGLADGSIGDATMGGGAVPAIRQRILNSKVISASLGKGRHIQLSQPIRLVLRHLRTENVTNPACVFWNYIDHAWSEDGCYVDRTNHTHTVCMCNHLTNFAILMDVVDDTAALGSLLGLFDETVRRLIYASVAVCVLMVGAALVAVRMFHGTFLKSHRITIAKNLYACVLVLEVLFVVGVSLPETSWLTGFTAAFLHCAFLCTVSWVFVEGFQLYVTLTTEEILLEVEKSSKIIWYYLLTYGLSFSIVAIALAIDPAAYTQSDFGVWMEPTGLFYCTFVTPVLIFVLATIVYAVMSSYILCNKYRTSLKNKEHTRLASVRFYLRCSTAFLLLLITGWTFGYAYMNAIKWDALGAASASVTDTHSMPSSLNGAGGGGAASASASAGAGAPTTSSTGTTLCGYLFALLNAAQGICLLAIHCTKNDRLRREYSNFVRSQPWLPRCLRCQTSGPQSATISGTPASSGGGGGSAGGGVGAHHQQQLQHPSPAIAAASGAKLQQQQQQHTITLERSVGGGGSPAIVGTLRGQLGGQHHPTAAGKASGAQQHEQPSPVSSAASTHPIYNGYNQQMLIGGDKAADMLLASSADAQKQAASAAEWNVYHQPAAVHALHNHHNPHHHHHHNHHQNNHATTMMHHHNHAMAAGMVGGGPGLGGGGGAVALQVSSMTLGGQTAGSASAGGIYFDRPKSGKKSSKANKAGGRQQQLQLLPSPPSPATAAHVHGIGGGAGYWTEKPHKRGGGGVGALQQHHHLHKSGVDLMRSFEQQQQPTTNVDMMAGDIMVGDGGAEEYDDDRLPVNYLARYHQQQQRQQQQQQQMHQLQQQQQPYHHHRSTTMMTNDDDDFDDHLGDEGDVMVDTATAAHRRGLLQQQQQQQHRRAQQQQHQQQQQHHFYNQYQAPPDHIGYSLEEPVYEEILHNRSSGSGGISTMMELQPPDFQSGGGRGRRRRTAPLSAARNVNDLHDDLDDDIDDGVDHDDDEVDDDDDDDEDLMMDGRSTNHLMMGGVGGGGGGGGSVNGADDMRSRQSTRPLMMKGLGGSSSSSNTNIAIAEPPPASSSSVPYDFGNTARQHLAHGSPGTDHGSHHGHHQQQQLQQHQGRNLSAMLDENNTVVCYLEPVTNQN